MQAGFDSISLVRAHGFGKLPQRLEQQIGERRTAQIFQQEGLPLALREEPHTPMPLRSMIRLFSRGARALGDRTFGLDVGEEMSHRAYGLWLEYSAGAPTLAEAIQRAMTTSWAHMSGPRLSLTAEQGRHILRFSIPPIRESKASYSDHLLLPILNFMRLYLGNHWRPEWIEVDYARDTEAFLVEERLQTPIHYAQPGTGLALNLAELHRKRLMTQPCPVRIVTLRDVFADIVLSDAPAPIQAFGAVVALRLLDGKADISGAAELVGVSTQGLQRRLRQKGYTYREIVNEARRNRALRLLIETRMSILEIALTLGYETHGSFIRAFTRWMGCPPSAYREQQVHIRLQ
ncbi:AraC family transcriptional regulator ligand-binding domain-containing protein [Xanthobacter sp. TB0139]|uniref:AraC family transcriptional regulator ligand-binding domain-containing protein n=1 Tax=Xanthobacter sp. TB0139 TaxID=3459178 RepID=UPI004039A20D